MRRKAYMYGTKRRKPKYGNIILTLAVLFLVILAAPRVSYMFKGYSLRAANNLVMSDADIEFDQNIDTLLSSSSYNKEKYPEYIDVVNYLNVHEVVISSSDYTGFINSLVDDKEYSLAAVKLIVATHDEEEIKILLTEDKDVFIEELSLIDFFRLEFYDEYIEYYNTFRKSAYKIVLEVNMRINYEPFDERILVQLETVDGFDNLINHFNKLPDGYEPKDLTRLQGPNFIYELYLEREVAEAYEALRQAAALEDYHLGVRSAYRPFAHQVEIYDSYIEKYMNEGYSEEEATKRTREFVAVPGHSEHQTGFALDWYLPFDDYCQSGKCLSSTGAYKWLLSNMRDYGFVLRYPSGKIKYTNIGFEPWHLRYVGVEQAKYMAEHNITMEEWYAMGKKIELEEE